MGDYRRILKNHPAKGSEGLSGDVLEIRRILERAGEAPVQVTLQPRGKSERHFGRVESVDPEAKRYVLRFTPADVKLIEDAAAESGSREVLTVLFVKGKYLVCVRSEWDTRVGSGLLFSYPERIYKLQRRKDIRYLIPSGYEIPVVVDVAPEGETEDKQAFPLLDLSASGLALHVSSPENLQAFEKGRLFRRMMFTLRGRRLNFDAEVKNHVPILNDQGEKDFKVGFEFTRISKDDLEYIEHFVVMQLAQSAI